MPLRFSLVWLLHFFLEYISPRNDVGVGCGLGLDASVSRPSRGAVVPRLGLASASELVRLVSVSSSEGLGLGLAST